MQTIETAGWSAEERALWQRLAAHPFERPEIALDFVGRLAADMGWSRSVALDAVEEYRRFCFLAVTGDGPATPSEEVDAAWHLHLTYSRDYWDVWCAQVLGRRLHHDPTAGGPADGARFREQYAGTLARYETRFGAPDPAFWPGTRDRFRGSPRYRMIDTDRVLVLTRPRLALPWRAAAIFAAAALGLSPGSASAQAVGPLDLNGPDFLALYAKLAVGAFLLSVLLMVLTRRALRAAVPDREPGVLNTVELAYVAGGPNRAADLVALTLLSSGAASVETVRRRMVVDASGIVLPPEIQPFVSCADGPMARPAFLRAVKDRLAPVVRSLVARELAIDPGRRGTTALVAMAPIIAVLAFGLAKVVVGLSRYRPVGLLLLTMAALAAAGVILHVLQPTLRTRAGERALGLYARRHARAARAPLAAELPLAFALTGLMALEAADPVQAGYLRYMISSGSGGSGTGCGGGDGGSGCGGGGCGGCGGGGGD